MGKNILGFVFAALLAALAMPMLGGGAARAGGAEVTSGEFATFASGIGRGYDISGRAHMVRRPSGSTKVIVHLEGLAPNASYPSHVHLLPCGQSDAGGHFKQNPGGASSPPNEIWPGFTTNPAGNGNARVEVNYIANAGAVSVVVHDTDGAKIACADLQ